jgi:hypothetical protein
MPPGFSRDRRETGGVFLAFAPMMKRSPKISKTI